MQEDQPILGLKWGLHQFESPLNSRDPESRFHQEQRVFLEGSSLSTGMVTLQPLVGAGPRPLDLRLLANG